MFSRIMRHEWRVLRADAILWVVAAVFAVSVAYGTGQGRAWTTFQTTTIANAVAEQSERYAALQARIDDLQRTGGKVAGFADPRNPTNVGARFAPRYAFLPPGPLGATAIGQSDLFPYLLKVTTDARENIMAATEIENPTRLLVGRFDLAFVIIFLFPLMILAVTFNMLSAEQEQGTLALALSQPVTLARLVTGKVTVRAVFLVGTIVAFSLAAVMASGAPLTGPGVVVHMGLWAAVVAAYGAFWFSLAVVVASIGRPSPTNASILAAAWLFFVVIVPSLINMSVTTLCPVPSRVELVQAMRMASDEANAAGATLLARYYDDHPELAVGDVEQATKDANVIRLAVNEDVDRRVRPVVARYEEQLGRQQQFVDRLRVLSPAIVMQDALNDLAGTGIARYRHFTSQVDTFHRQWRAHFSGLIVRKAQISDVSTSPSFVYEDEPLGAVLARVGQGLATLATPAVLLAAFGLRRLGHYRVAG